MSGTNNNTVNRRVKRIGAVRATGSSILIELLKNDEILNSKILVNEDSDVGLSPQGYVLHIGPGLDRSVFGFDVGDRVVLQGTFVPIPNFDDSPRSKAIVDPHTIKAVIEEK